MRIEIEHEPPHRSLSPKICLTGRSDRVPGVECERCSECIQRTRSGDVELDRRAARNIGGGRENAACRFIQRQVQIELLSRVVQSRHQRSGGVEPSCIEAKI